VEFPGHRIVKAVSRKHPVMMYENQSDGCLSCQNDSIGNPSTHWKCQGTGSAQCQVHTWTGSEQTQLVQTSRLPAAQCDVPPPRMNVTTRLPRVFDPLGDDEDKEDGCKGKYGLVRLRTGWYVNWGRYGCKRE
jgi:hypothetical protein